MKYKVTRRGWIVFSTLALLLILLIYNIGSSIFDGDSNESLNDDVNASNISQEGDQEEANQEEENDSTEVSEVTDTETTEETADNQTDVTETEVAEEESEDDNTTSTTENYSQYIGTTVEIYFEKNVAKLQDEFKLKLDDLIVILKEFESLSVTVEGHINGYPYYEDGDFGLKISNDRAIVVANYLYKNGISEDRIVIVNMGSRDQVDKSDQIEMHYLNRRAVLKLHE